MYFWCYIFYLSKYYELVDTALLMLRGKRVIALHAIHHAFIPLTMCILFDGGVSVSLVSLSIVNGFVHFVMYGYFLAVDLGFAPPLWWKRSITQLQILQVTHCAPVAKLPPHGVPGPLALLSACSCCVRLPQFTIGVVGGSYYWQMHMRDLKLHIDPAALLPTPWLSYTPTCAGGEPIPVLLVGAPQPWSWSWS